MVNQTARRYPVGLGLLLLWSAACESYRVAGGAMEPTLKDGERVTVSEEPPPRTLLLLVSHVRGLVLPTIRSRCRRLDFQSLGDDAMTSLLEIQLPALKESERSRIVARAGGSVGRALAFAALDLAKLEEAASRILRDGDPTNAKRSQLAQSLALKSAQPRYEAFLARAPSLIAAEASTSSERSRFSRASSPASPASTSAGVSSVSASQTTKDAVRRRSSRRS